MSIHLDVINRLDKIYKFYLRSGFIGNDDIKEKTKYFMINSSTNYLEKVLTYIYMDELYGLSINFGIVTLKKGYPLYRIRKYQEGIDFSSKLQWTPPPHKPEGRLNKKGQSALYLATSEDLCLKETHIKQNEEYVLAKYIVKEDIFLGGFYRIDTKHWNLYQNQRDLGIILNAFLIAPHRSENNSNIFNFLDSYYGKIRLSDLNDIDDLRKYHGIKLPLKFAQIDYNALGLNFYKMTNSLCYILLKQHSEGICYSSCFCGLNTFGEIHQPFNVVLYQDGQLKIDFISSKKKKCLKSLNSLEMIFNIAKLER